MENKTPPVEMSEDSTTNDETVIMAETPPADGDESSSDFTVDFTIPVEDSPAVFPPEDDGSSVAQSNDGDDGHKARPEVVVVPNVTQTDPCYLPIKDGEQPKDTLILPSATADLLNEHVTNSNQINFSGSESDREWALALQAGVEMGPVDQVVQDALDRPGSDWRQRIDLPDRPLYGVHAMSARPKGDGTEVTGDSALIATLTHIGSGALFRAQMPHTGIWITFKPATDSELIDLNHLILSTRIQLGRESYGLHLSNESVVLTQYVYEMIANHIYNTSVDGKQMPIENLRDHLVPQDLPSYLWGFISAQYPHGFDYLQACLNVGNCNHVEHARFNLRRAQLIDNSRLSEWQKNHMAAAATPFSRTLEQVNRYKEELSGLQPRRHVIAANTDQEMAIYYRTPSVREYFDQGHRWINGMVDVVDRAIREKSNEGNERNNLVNYHARAGTLNQYLHWIEKVELGRSMRPDGTEERVSVIKDRDSLVASLAGASSDDNVRNEIIKGVQNYISDSTIAVIGAPSYDCPVCHKPFDFKLYNEKGEFQGGEKRPWIALDMLQVFTGLLTRRLSKIQNR